MASTGRDNLCVKQARSGGWGGWVGVGGGGGLELYIPDAHAVQRDQITLWLFFAALMSKLLTTPIQLELVTAK